MYNITNSASVSNNQCYDVLNKGAQNVTNHSIGGVIILIGVLYIFMSLVIMYIIRLNQLRAQQHLKTFDHSALNDTALLDKLNIIFPVFVNVLWVNAFVNMFCGLCVILMVQSIVEISVSEPSIVVAFSFIYASQHAITEGVAFLLMQKGLGIHAARVTFKWMFVWFAYTFVSKAITYKTERYNPNVSFAIDFIWNFIQLTFYMILWKASPSFIFRRQPAILYSKLWFIYRVIVMITTGFLYYGSFFQRANAYCTQIFGPVLLYAIFEPAVVYYTLLADSKWWTGNNLTSEMVNGINAPLEGVDLNLVSAQHLAASIDKIGKDNVSKGSKKIRLLNFSYITLKKDSLLGTGSFSKVYKGTYKGVECAIKLVFTVDLTQSEVQRVMKEAQILSSIKHPNIVSIFGVSVYPPSVCILLELCDYGSLADILKGNNLFSTEERLHSNKTASNDAPILKLSMIDRIYLALGCARGLAALHDLDPNLTHRDIKSFNFLVDKHLNAKLADLELGTTYKHRIRNSVYAKEASVGNGFFSSLLVDTFFDSNTRKNSVQFSSNKNIMIDPNEILANWTAPEVLNDGDFTQASDVYSFGLVLWEILSGTQPYKNLKNQEAVREAVLSGERPPLPQSWEDLDLNSIWGQYKLLIQTSWQENVAKRPSSATIRNVLEVLWRRCYSADGLYTDIKPVFPESVKTTNGSDTVMAFLSKHYRTLVNNTADINMNQLENIKYAKEASQVIQTDSTYEILDTPDPAGAVGSWMIVTATAPHYIMRVNKPWCNLVELQAENIIGLPLTSFMNGKGTDIEEMKNFSSRLKAIVEYNPKVYISRGKEKGYSWNQLNNSAADSRPSKKDSNRSVGSDSMQSTDDLCIDDQQLFQMLATHTLLKLYKEDDACSLYSLHAFPIYQRTKEISKRPSRKSVQFASENDSKTTYSMIQGIFNSPTAVNDDVESNPVILFAMNWSELKQVWEYNESRVTSMTSVIDRISVGNYIPSIALSQVSSFASTGKRSTNIKRSSTDSNQEKSVINVIHENAYIDV